ncbi:hypothetical protein GQR58_023292 [Nymphon striatum]|nr:hypothetical protein GQR58_023292 [Nymphon striatum]
MVKLVLHQLVFSKPIERSTGGALTDQIRDIATVENGFNVPGYTVNQGFDYAILENARKLDANRDFDFNSQLGYISLNQRLSNDEKLALKEQKCHGTRLTLYSIQMEDLQKFLIVIFDNTNRGSNTLPDVEDIDRDLTMNTVNSYYEYRIQIKPNSTTDDKYVTDILDTQEVPTSEYKIPLSDFTEAVGGITDFRSISFMRMYMTGFNSPAVLRFATLDLVRGDWRTYLKNLQDVAVDTNPDDDGTTIDVNAVNIEENENRTPIPYVLPPGVVRERLNNNNTVIRQNEQSLSFVGSIRNMMVGIKNVSDEFASGEVWFNELRLAGLDNNGGWAAIAAIDANIADFANITATGSKSTSGFGAIDQMPNERSREDAISYDLVTNVNVGQLLPKKWGIQIPFNYGISEEIITPEFDPVYDDLKLQDLVDAEDTQEGKDAVLEQAEDYTKRTSINLIGLRKDRGEEADANFYDIENFTFNYSYNETEHRDFEIKRLRDQTVNTGFVYNHAFQPLEIAPFAKKDSLFTGKYWKWLKDINLNLLPATVSLNSNINRQFNQQRFRDVIEEGVDALELPLLQQRKLSV